MTSNFCVYLFIEQEENDVLRVSVVGVDGLRLCRYANDVLDPRRTKSIQRTSGP